MAERLPQAPGVLGHGVNPNIFVYYDLERDGWRYFRRTNLAAVDGYERNF